MKLYMATTNDMYELPCFVSDKAKDVADFLGMTIGSFHSVLSRHVDNANHNGYHVYRVEVEND